MDTGKLLILAGIGIVLFGMIIKYAPWLINWFGKLPGDIDIHSENGRVFIPITSMIVISVLASLILNLWVRK
ncbi:MAG: DUF2905 domain-containing protein [Gammaproteobacteria bacterium]